MVFNLGYFQIVDNLLPFGAIMSYPLWLLEISQAAPNTSLTTIEAQGWIIAVVGAAMGLVKIALWLRNYKESKEGSNGLEDIQQSFDRSWENLKLIINKLTDNDERLSINQQKLADNQMKALENHNRLAEALTLLRLQIQSMEQNLVSLQERRTMGAVGEIKDAIREGLRRRDHD